MKSTGAQSSNDLQRHDLKIGHQDSSDNNDHQVWHMLYIYVVVIVVLVTFISNSVMLTELLKIIGNQDHYIPIIVIIYVTAMTKWIMKMYIVIQGMYSTCYWLLLQSSYWKAWLCNEVCIAVSGILYICFKWKTRAAQNWNRPGD